MQHNIKQGLLNNNSCALLECIQKICVNIAFNTNTIAHTHTHNCSTAKSRIKANKVTAYLVAKKA